MNLRSLFASRGKLRAPWRLFLFLVLTVAALWPLLMGVNYFVVLPTTREGVWDFSLPGALIVGTLLLSAFAGALLVSSAVMMRWVERRAFIAIGLPLGRELPLGLGKGVVLGGGFMACLVVIQAAVGWLRPAADPGTLSAWFGSVSSLALFLGVAAAVEELTFRGYPFQVLVEAIGPRLAVLLSSGAFAVVHVTNPEVGWIAIVNIGLAGAIMAVVYLRTWSLWTVIGLHWAWNWVMAAVFDLPVSGLDFDVPGYETVERGPDLLSGGAFGPEGGLLTTVLSFLLLIWLLRTPWLRRDRRVDQIRPLFEAVGDG